MDSRKKIIEAAVTVFSQTGFHNSKVDDIAKLAGVAKGTLYYNFPSKSKIFAAAVVEGLEDIINNVQKELASELPFIEHFKKLIECNVTLYLKHGDLTKIYFNELSSGIDREVLDEIEAVRERFIGFIAEMVRDGQEKGYLKPLDTRLAAVGIVGLLDSLSNDYLKTNDNTSKEILTETMFEILSSGLLAK